MASVAVLLFAMVAVFIMMANFQLNYSVSMSGDAFDTLNSRIVEKNGIAQIVKESILAVGETATVTSTNPVGTEIQNRLNSMNFPAGVSVTVNSVAALPANPFFPFGTPAATAWPSYFSTAPRGIAGMGGLFTSLAIQGPVADLGRYTFAFTRSSTQAPGEDWTYSVNADLFSVPLTNIDVVAYGLPASGSVPTQAPTVPLGTFSQGLSTLVVTSNNPASDPTAYPDLYAPSGQEVLPYQYRNAASFSWNAYEYLWNRTYQDGLMATARAEADPGNQAPSVSNPNPASGALYDFSSGNNPSIAGLTANGNAITIDCSAVQSSVIAVVDSEGVGSVTIQGSAAGNPVNGTPFILLIRNTAGGLGQTQIVFTGNNCRPAIFYLENSNVGFAADPQIQGALFLDPTTVATGSVSWYGHLSFYAPANPLGAFSIAMNDSPSVKTALAPIAPRVLLVSTTATSP